MKNLCLVRVSSTEDQICHICQDLVFLFFLQPKGSGTTGRYQTHSEKEEGMDGENEDDRERGRGRIELPGSHTANINPSERKRRRVLTSHRGVHVI